MRKFNALVFDEYVPSSTQVFTSSNLDDRLGLPNTLSLFAVADNVGAQGATLTVQIQHSADRRNWLQKNVNNPEISGATLNAGVTTAAQGFDSSPSNGNFGFVRLAITLGGMTPSAHVKIYVTGRDDSGS